LDLTNPDGVTMAAVTENTVSRATEASALFAISEDADNRRRRRSAEPAKAVGFQFERVYDIVGSEAIVLCDRSGRKLSSVGDDQLCRLLSKSVPTIYGGNSSKLDYQLKAMDIIRPDIDFSHIALDPIAVPHQCRQLFVASISESNFNPAGVSHAGEGVRRILGVPDPYQSMNRVVSSKDRLSYDVARGIDLGYQDFNDSEIGSTMRRPRRRAPSRRMYGRALEQMMARADRRLKREGLRADRPGLWTSFWSRDEALRDGNYRRRRFELPLRFLASGRQWGVLSVTMVCGDRNFEIPQAPRVELQLIN